MEKKVICGVEVWKITKNQYDHYMKMEDESCMNRFHLFMSDTKFSPSCFPELGGLSLKKEELMEAGVCSSSHFTICEKGKRVICTLGIKDKEGDLDKNYAWKAPTHKVGECPFINYPE